jgi:predicted SprT family Zn-dependent metalloprotease
MLNKLIEVVALAHQLMEEHGLIEAGWTFELAKDKTTVGWCRHEDKRIELSIEYIKETPMEELKDTILHEIAHALVGVERVWTGRRWQYDHHGYKWQAKCVEIGAKPMRLAGESAQNTAKPNYVMECPTCGRTWERYRMRRRNYGGKCPDCHVQVCITDLRTGEVLYAG